MSIFPTLAEMQDLARPLVADAAEQFGSPCDIHEIVAVRQPGGSYTDTPQLKAADVRIRLKNLATVEAQRLFGEETIVTMKGSMVRSVEVKAGDVIEVMADEFAGEWLRVADLKDKPLSDSYTLGLVTNKALR